MSLLLILGQDVEMESDVEKGEQGEDDDEILLFLIFLLLFLCCCC